MSEEPLKPAKAKRLSPMTRLEQEHLLNLIDQNKHILQSKQYDARSIKRKEKAWAKIAKQYCAMPDAVPRTSKQLRQCWKNWKLKAKKNVALPDLSIVKRETGKKTGRGTTQASDEISLAVSMIREQLHLLDNDDDDTSNTNSMHEDEHSYADKGTDNNVNDETTASTSAAVMEENTHPQATVTDQSPNKSVSATSVSASAKRTMEEHNLKIKLLRDQISYAKDEHDAKMDILNKQKKLLDIQISQARMGRPHPKPKGNESQTPTPQINFNLSPTYEY